MSIFHQEVQRGRDLAKGARYKKNGSKSRKCALPSDRCTEAQLKKKNGKVQTYSVNCPLTWKQFKALPHDLQQEYISYLQDTFNVSSTQLSDMFGCSAQTVLNHVNNSGLTYIRKPATGMLPEDKAAWDRFFEQDTPDNAVQSPVTESKITTTSTLPKGVGRDTTLTQGSNKMNLEKFNIQFTGVANPMEILTLLTALVGGQTGTVTVSFKAEERN